MCVCVCVCVCVCRANNYCIVPSGLDISFFVTVPVFFNISVCSLLNSTAPTPAVCRGSHVCYTEDFQEFTNVGACSSCRYSVDNNALTVSYMCAREAIPVVMVWVR